MGAVHAAAGWPFCWWVAIVLDQLGTIRHGRIHERKRPKLYHIQRQSWQRFREGAHKWLKKHKPDMKKSLAKGAGPGIGGDIGFGGGTPGGVGIGGSAGIGGGPRPGAGPGVGRDFGFGGAPGGRPSSQQLNSFLNLPGAGPSAGQLPAAGARPGAEGQNQQARRDQMGQNQTARRVTQLARHSLRLLGDQSWNGEDAQEVVEAAKVMLEALANPDY